jgi:hypothetical protein
MTVPIQPEPSDATRFATRPKQRRKELVNATDNTQAKLRRETLDLAENALAMPTKALLSVGDWLPDIPGDQAKARHLLEEGMWRQWVEDDRTLDPETVAEQFARAEREHAAAIHNRAVLRAYGVTA